MKKERKKRMCINHKKNETIKNEIKKKDCQAERKKERKKERSVN